MFIEQGIGEENKFWKYLLGSLIIIIGSVVGQIPLMVGLFIKTLTSKKKFPLTEGEMMKFLDPNLTFFLIILSFVFALGTLFIVLNLFHKQSILSITTTRKSVDWNRILFSFSIWAIVSIAITFIDYYYNPSNYIWNFKPLPFSILILISFVFLPFQTSCEEYVFRGYLMQGFGNLAKNKWFPLLMTSVIFGTMHILNPEVKQMGYIILVYYIGTGFLLGIMTLMDDGMELSLGFHAANNIFTAILVTSDWTVFQTDSLLKDISKPEAGAEIFIPVLVIYPILLFILSKKYGWTNWKEKLTGKVFEPINEIETIGNE